MNYYQVFIFLHTFTGLLLAAAFYLHILAFKELIKCFVPKSIKKTILTALMLGVILSAIFIYLQADWVVNSHYEELDDLVNWAWLFFDYLMVFYLCFVALSVRSYALWRARRTIPKKC